MKKIIQFGEDVEGYNIPVLNEREIRASAGILFLLVLISLMLILFKGDFLPTKYVITVLLTDFIIRVFVNPKFSPSLIIGRLIVRNQVPEYVGAKQKKFAWVIGVVLAADHVYFFGGGKCLQPDNRSRMFNLPGISCSLNRHLVFVWDANFIQCFIKKKHSTAPVKFVM